MNDFEEQSQEAFRYARSRSPAADLVREHLGMENPGMKTPENEVQIVRNAMARTIHVLAISDTAKRIGFGIEPGTDWMAVVDRVPPLEAVELAKRLEPLIEKAFGGSLDTLIAESKAQMPVTAADLQRLGRDLVLDVCGLTADALVEPSNYARVQPTKLNIHEILQIGEDDLECVPGLSLTELHRDAQLIDDDARLEAILAVPATTRLVEEDEVMTPEVKVQHVREGMARTIHVCVVADAAESMGYIFPAQSDLMDLVRDERPEVVGVVTQQLVDALEHANGTKLEALIQRAEASNPELEFDQATLESLGFYLAMQAQGHGVGWADDHEPFECKMPVYFAPGDSIWVGLDDLKALPGFDLEELRAEALDADDQDKLDAMSDIPEQTQSAYIEGYEPPMPGM
ncbi:hypothetical protein [Geopseudomonas aromaticivorans]